MYRAYLPMLDHNGTRNRQRKLVTQILESFEEYVENYTSLVVARLAYGDIQGLLEALSPMKRISNLVSPLRHLPAWLSPWKREKLGRHAKEREFFMRAAAGACERMRAGTAPWSFMKRRLRNQIQNGARVQEEVDRVCSDRLLSVSDSPQMPVLRTSIMEVERWRPIVLGAIPRRTIEDDFYDGYFTPKGSHIHASAWAITRDTCVPLRKYSTPTAGSSPPLHATRSRSRNTPTFEILSASGTELALALVRAWPCTSSSWQWEIAGIGREVEVPMHDYNALVTTKPNKF
ncbi:cytochrome P450 [Polyplosphaeria fusca]|uniref:Cytochrome P450 n=1 Tax=Polyplosphaeria fusca TaxID=682080 RepID=A0A9P4QW68_9PLEO|nr:cytochrome P450 [Polyplosphaeria fusca]